MTALHWLWQPFALRFIGSTRPCQLVLLYVGQHHCSCQSAGFCQHTYRKGCYTQINTYYTPETTNQPTSRFHHVPNCDAEEVCTFVAFAIVSGANRCMWSYFLTILAQLPLKAGKLRAAKCVLQSACCCCVLQSPAMQSSSPGIMRAERYATC